jgi:hypothetical protein
MEAKMSAQRPKVGFYSCASCVGREETVVDLAEDILKVVEAVDKSDLPPINVPPVK